MTNPSHIPPEGNTHEPDVVERVARSIYNARISGGQNYCDFDDLCTNGHNEAYESVIADARAAIAALTPPTRT